jgi:hypothetical protein
MRFGGSCSYQSGLRNLTYLAELWNVDETGQVLQIRALIIEASQIVMLCIVSFTKRRQGIDIVGS